MLLREKVWFPGIDALVENTIKSCISCQASTPQNHIEPYKMSELPKAPWTEVSVDFCGPFPTREYLMVVVDEYTRYPIVEILKSVSHRCVIPWLDQSFSMFSIPEVVKTDNGPPFLSDQFRQFASYLGFHHRKITPHWPRANAEAERFMKTLSKIIRAAVTDNVNWRQNMHNFLRNYRTAPHCSTGAAPVELLFNRPFQTKLPQVPQQRITKDAQIRENDKEAKDKIKIYGDRFHRKQSPIKLVTQYLLSNQSRTNFQPHSIKDL